MSPRIAGASLAVAGLLTGIGAGFLVGRETAPRTPDRGSVPVNAAPRNAPAADAADADLVAALRREIGELRAREVRLKLAALGARRPRRPADATDGRPDTGPAVAGAGPTPARPDSPEALLEALRKAFGAQDGPAQAWLRALVEQGLRDGSLPAVTVAAWLAGETDPGLLDALTESLAAGAEPAPEMVSALLDAAERGAGDANRLAAMQVINAQGEISPDALARLSALAEKDSSPEVRMEAINALTRCFEDPSSAQRDAVAELLLRTARGDPLPRLRAEAVMALNAAGLAARESEALLDVLRSDRDEDVRATAAGVLPSLSGIPREARLSAMEQAYASESSPMVRRMLLSSIVQTGGPATEALLRRLRPVDNAFLQDIDDYLGILGSGVTDGAEIEMRKAGLGQDASLPGSDR